MTTKQMAEYSRPINGLRGLMALWVVLYHIIRFRTHEWQGTLSFLNFGYLGVDVFFILSGFILSYVYQNWNFGGPNWQAYRQFIWLRFARIYPLHIVILTIFVIYLVTATALGLRAGHWTDLDFISALIQACLIEAWGFAEHTTWNVPSWSISAEAFAYILFPFLIVHIRKLEFTGACLYLAGGLLAGAVYSYLHDGLHSTVRFGLIRIAIEFNIGCALYLIVRSGRISEWHANLFCLTAIIGFIGYFMVATGGKTEVIFLLLAALLVLGLFKGRTKLHALLGSAPMFYLGEISYAIYMVHWLIYHLYVNISDKLPEFFSSVAATVVFVFMFTITASVFLYHYVEVPSRRFLRGLSQKNKQSASS